MPKIVTDRTKQYPELLDLKESDITDTFIIETFGEFNGKQKCAPWDTLTVPPGKYGPEKKKNKNTFVTTVGRWVYNKLMFEESLFDIFGYINKDIDAGMNKFINNQLSYALTEDRITVDTMAEYLMKPEWMMQFVEILAYNYSEKILTCSKMAEKKKKELIKKYEKELAAGDVVTMNKIEKEVLNYVLDYLGDEDALDVFKSGARGSLDNNFKNIFVMNGAIKNSNPNIDKDFVFAASNYIDGISAEEYPIFADSMTNGPYARGKKTQLGGYWEKLFGRAYETVILDKEGTDCKTTGFEVVTITSKNINNFMYSWIIEGKELVELTSANMNKYLDKKVKIRFPTYCKSKTGYCSKCSGNLFYRTNRHNIGVASPMIPSILKNVSMKSFHNSAVKLHKMDVAKAFGFDE